MRGSVCAWAGVLIALLAIEISHARAEEVVIGRGLTARAPRHPYAASSADSQRTGRLHGRAPRERPRAQWTRQLAERGLVPPAVLADGTLLVGSRTGLHALAPDNGQQQWLARIGAIRFTPVVTESKTAIAIADDHVFAVDPRGSARPLAKAVVVARAPLLLEGDRPIVIGEDGFLYALTLQGELASVAATGIDRPKALALIAPGLALVSGDDRRVARVSTDGHASRLIETDAPVVTTAVIGDDGSSFLLTESGHALVLDPGGARRSDIALDPPFIVSSPALGRDGDLRVGLEAGEIVCLAPDGTERWRRGLDGRPSAIAIDVDDTALLVTSRGTLYAIEKNGELRWLMAVGAMRAGRPVLAADGTIYLVWRGGHIAAYR